MILEKLGENEWKKKKKNGQCRKILFLLKHAPYRSNYNIGQYTV